MEEGEGGGIAEIRDGARCGSAADKDRKVLSGKERFADISGNELAAISEKRKADGGGVDRGEGPIKERTSPVEKQV